MQIDDTSPQTTSTARAQRDKRGLRFQLSTLLLLSALNGMAIAAVAITLFSSIAAPSQLGGSARQVTQTISAIHSEMLLLAVNGHERSTINIPEALNDAERALSSLGDAGHTALSDLVVYRSALKRWENFWRDPAEPVASTDGSAATPSTERSDDSIIQKTDRALTTDAGTDTAKAEALQGVPIELNDEGRALLAELNHAHRRLTGELSLLTNLGRPDWIQQVEPYVPYAFGWVFVVALGTTVMAFRVQNLLSKPLDLLRQAAATVSDGHLENKIPDIQGAEEIQELGHSVEAMRRRLVQTITTLDSRNDELGTILNSLNDGVLVIDHLGIILEVNRRAEEVLTGRIDQGKAPTKGVRLLDVFPALPENVLLEKVGTALEHSFRLASERKRFVMIRIEPMRSRDVEGAFVVVVRDITNEQEVEQMKRDFLSVITHELKTPLTSIEGYTKLLLMGKGGQLSDRQRVFASTISEQTGALKSMIQNLLDITRLEGAKLPIKAVVVNPEEAITVAAESVRGTMQIRNMNLVLEPGNIGSVKINVDPFRVQQVLGNLLSNALKFTPDGGSITILGGATESFAWIGIEDSGRGIPADAIPRLFGKFYQVAQGDTRVAGGAGLGLFICKELVTAQGGQIEVTSTIGKGSRFTIRFPIVEGDEQALDTAGYRALVSASAGSSSLDSQTKGAV